MGKARCTQRWMVRQARVVGFTLTLAVAALGSAGLGSRACAQFAGPALKLPTQPTVPLVPTTDPALLDVQAADLTISAGDVLTIRIFGSTDFVPVVKVSVDGSVQLPLIGLIRLAGLTVERAEDVIAQRLIDAGMYKNPQVTVQVTEAVNQYATVTGELRAVVPLIGQRRLLDVLAAAGAGGGTGVSANANIASSVLASSSGWPATASHVITILRQGQTKPIVIDLGTDPQRTSESNIIILPHDVIIIAKVGVVYVVGAFTRQGAIPLDQNSPLTLMQATALSGGLGFEGRYEDLRIIRTEGLERKVVKVDIKRVLHGKAADPVLQADDIVFLPSNLLKAALKSNGVSTLLGVASLAVLAAQSR